MCRATLCALALLGALPLIAPAAEEAGPLEQIDVYLDNVPSLQRGAKYFVNYCSGCHSLKYMRYRRLAEDLDLTPQQVEKNLIFTGHKIGDTMTIAMRAKDAEKWFGKAPPDLSVEARARGEDWLYTFLKTFYLDDTGRFGVNNLVYPDVAMPHVLGVLQGWQIPVYKKHSGSEEPAIDHLRLAQPGLMPPDEYDRVVRDLVTFLAYVGEPSQLTRMRVGFWALLFLAVLLVLSYLLYKEYWKDVH
jgi:ubiquinol-cytochrome c reductase cytochrome c1 subunit